MTAHVFIVTEDTFPTHLKYMFAGTGAGEEGRENIGMITDISGCRVGDKVIFYLTQSSGYEGKFFGVFEVSSNAFWERNGEYLYSDLEKRLTNRILIKPYEVYSEGVSEWDALDNLDNLPMGGNSPVNCLIWSLIYRKLEGERGCTPIFNYEYEQLLELIKRQNKGSRLKNVHNYKIDDRRIKELNDAAAYGPEKVGKNGIPLLDKINPKITYNPEEKIALVKKGLINYKTSTGKMRVQHKCEEELEYFFVKNIDDDKRIAEITGEFSNLEFWGTQIFSGVGKRRIDVLTIAKNGEVRLIELKDEEFAPYQLDQLKKYIKWAKQYLREPKEMKIQPILVVNGFFEDTKPIEEFNEAIKPHKNLIMFSWKIQNDKLAFEKIKY